MALSVAYRALLARIDVGRGPALEEKRRHVLGEKRPRLRIHHVESVMVDQHRLLLEPIRPALRADFIDHACADRARKGRLHESRARLSATRAGYSFRHARFYLRA